MNCKETAKQFRYRPDIEGLRGLAVLMVIIFHLNEKWLPGGFTGVDIFFVISGYVVTGSILKREDKNLRDYFLGFYARRIKRLVPALFVCTLATLLLTALFIPPTETESIYFSGVASALGLSNFYFTRKADDYFGLGQELNPFTHTWSLGVEEQFYLVFPLLLLFAYGLKRPIKQSYKKGTILILIAFVLSGSISYYLTMNKPIWSFYLMPSRFWELAAGSLLFILFLSDFQLPNTLRKPAIFALQVSSVALISLGMTSTSPRESFPFPGALPSVLGSVLFIAAGNYSNSKLNLLTSNKILLLFGRISYSLYLWHWVFFTFFRWTLGLDDIWNKALALILTIGFSLASYYWVEKPIRKWEPLNRSKIYVFACLGIIIVVVSAITLKKPLGKAFFLDKSTSNELPEKWWPRACHEDKFFPKLIESCLLTSSTKKNPSRRIYLIGDSHAANFKGMLKVGESDLGYTVKDLTMGSRCGYLPETMYNQRIDVNTNCTDYNTSINEKLVSAIQPGDIVAVSVDRAKILGENIYYFSSLSYLERKLAVKRASSLSNNFQQYIESFGEAVAEKGGIVLLIGDVPMMRRDPRLCSWRAWKDCGIDKKISNIHASPINNAFKTTAEKLDNVFFWNPHDLLCEEEDCLPKINHIYAFINKGHISDKASEYLYPFFRKFMKKEELF